MNFRFLFKIYDGKTGLFFKKVTKIFHGYQMLGGSFSKRKWMRKISDDDNHFNSNVSEIFFLVKRLTYLSNPGRFLYDKFTVLFFLVFSRIFLSLFHTFKTSFYIWCFTQFICNVMFILYWFKIKFNNFFLNWQNLT